MLENKIDTFYIDKYRELLLDYRLWKEKADYLYKSAKLLKPEIEKDWQELKKGKVFNNQFSSIYFMLSSFAIENLLKAIIIKNNFKAINNQVKNKSELPSMLCSHDLCYLGKKANLNDIANDEKFLLEKLSENAIWKGRYPIPKGSEDHRGQITFYTSSDYKWTEKLIKELKIALNKIS
ncbi:MAG: hypothetical protein ABIH71_01790 [Candidatus Omnitrophota bacterium]